MPYPPNWMLRQILAPVIRPATRLIIGMLAIPILRLLRKKVARTKEWDDEFEKDVEQWFRSSLLLFFATKNVELWLGSWLDLKFNFTLDHWWVTAGRLLLAVGVVESMPDQELFSIVHPGPPRLKWVKERGIFGNISDQFRPMLRGLVCQHLNRSSPVLAIMAAIMGGTVGWVCYAMAITQYLIIGLVTSRDKARDVLSEFDRQVARRRQELVEEFEIEGESSTDEELPEPSESDPKAI
ncbi:hypothetical protein KOR42_39800 [Thalassoglobus neptunius]|uniref:Uncharacterized protein n=1 Tax=Thalassoglobus neptunius TaxID=1938619 RepID=A0A5C5WGC0_9PLAN|nr:DNA topoisomerase I [Thalassoglobus neptunius]TWT49063.1 hypothetical protein KOR42_39800 [Thalassoglobus neptunius]